ASTTSAAAQGPVSSNQIYEPEVAADQTTLYKTVASSEPEYAGSQEYSGGSGQSYGGGGGGYQKDSYKEEKYPHQPYGFGYNVDDGYGNKQWRHEKSQTPHAVSGTYGYKDKNGILREVNYVADEKGFRAMIKTTEPGTAPKDPSYVKMDANPIAVEYYPPSKKGGAGSYSASSKPASYSGEGELYADSGNAGGGSGASAGASGYSVSGGNGGDQYLESKSSIKFADDSNGGSAGYA
ncbi:PREDICTED: adult-specific rigid cuticular protein 15.7-like, partial [Rhagoletis zephyria]|uniref:adult-specific rigid cuticular protein 15.7-like n=1 Tax=Rhagoletis zephyria TaxID=28612 RepID=UPI000811889A